jgi:hypothetical protein
VHRNPSIVFVLAAVLLAGAACSGPSPEEQVAMARARYEASLNGFIVEQQPLAPLAEAAEGDASEPEGGDVEGEGDPAAPAIPGAEPGIETAPVDVQQNVLLDIVIRHESSVKLDGITVDVTMAQGEAELEVWRLWFDTSQVEKGPGAQYSHTLEDVDYQPGYGFSAEIRHPVPAEDRHLYKEFSGLGG